MLALRPFRWLDKQPASDLICKTVTCEILQLVHMYIMTKVVRFSSTADRGYAFGKLCDRSEEQPNVC